MTTAVAPNSRSRPCKDPPYRWVRLRPPREGCQASAGRPPPNPRESPRELAAAVARLSRRGPRPSTRAARPVARDGRDVAAAQALLRPAARALIEAAPRVVTHDELMHPRLAGTRRRARDGEPARQAAARRASTTIPKAPRYVLGRPRPRLPAAAGRRAVGRRAIRPAWRERLPSRLPRRRAGTPARPWRPQALVLAGRGRRSSRPSASRSWYSRTNTPEAQRRRGCRPRPCPPAASRCSLSRTAGSSRSDGLPGGGHSRERPAPARALSGADRHRARLVVRIPRRRRGPAQSSAAS